MEYAWLYTFKSQHLSSGRIEPEMQSLSWHQRLSKRKALFARRQSFYAVFSDRMVGRNRVPPWLSIKAQFFLKPRYDVVFRQGHEGGSVLVEMERVGG